MLNIYAKYMFAKYIYGEFSYIYMCGEYIHANCLAVHANGTAYVWAPVSCRRLLVPLDLQATPRPRLLPLPSRRDSEQYQ